MGKLSVWTEEELEIIKSCDGMTYDAIQVLIPSKSRDAIAYKCKTLGIKALKKNNRWTKEEDAFLTSFSKGKTYEEIKRTFPNRTPQAVEMRCQQLNITEGIILNPTSWSVEETEILRSLYPSTHIDKLVALFPNRSKESICTQAIRMRLCKNKSYTDAKKKLNPSCLLAVFSRYKEVLEGNQSCYFYENKTHISILFKYYLKRNNIPNTKEYIINNFHFGTLLEDAKLKPIVKKLFNGYFDFISFCFPLYKFKIWEFKKLDVPNGYWDNDINCFECIEESISDMKKDNIIDNDCEILSLSFGTLKQYINKTLISLRNKDILIKFLDFNGVAYNPSEYKVFDGVVFDSFEEMEVYKLIKSLGYEIQKLSKKDKLNNLEENESYIPDFLLNQEVLVEYYGLWGASGIFESYSKKTLRKNDFYKNSGYKLIALYPDDLKENYKGIKSKLSKYVN